MATLWCKVPGKIHITATDDAGNVLYYTWGYQDVGGENCDWVRVILFLKDTQVLDDGSVIGKSLWKTKCNPPFRRINDAADANAGTS